MFKPKHILFLIFLWTVSTLQAQSTVLGLFDGEITPVDLETGTANRIQTSFPVFGLWYHDETLFFAAYAEMQQAGVERPLRLFTVDPSGLEVGTASLDRIILEKITGIEGFTFSGYLCLPISRRNQDTVLFAMLRSGVAVDTLAVQVLHVAAKNAYTSGATEYTFDTTLFYRKVEHFIMQGGAPSKFSVQSDSIAVYRQGMKIIDLFVDGRLVDSMTIQLRDVISIFSDEKMSPVSVVTSNIVGGKAAFRFDVIVVNTASNKVSDFNLHFVATIDFRTKQFKYMVIDALVAERILTLLW